MSVPLVKPIDIELAHAVYERDVKSVKTLLAQGANPNQKIKMYPFEALDDSLLHGTRNLEIVKELLFHGADVNVKNKLGHTPLFTAIKEAKGLEIIKVLLRNRAEVNIIDQKGKTPLCYALIQKYFSFNVLDSKEILEIIKVLLEHDSDIGYNFLPSNWAELISIHEMTSRMRSAFDIVIRKKDLEIGELFIRYTLLRDFNKDIEKLYLDPNILKFFYALLHNGCDGDLETLCQLSICASSYYSLEECLNRCIKEIYKMKSELITNSLSLYDIVQHFVTTKKRNKLIKVPLSRNVINKVISKVSNSCYPVYYDLMSEKMKLGLELSKLLELNICVNKTNCCNSVNGYVSLNLDCVYVLARYLYTEDILNLITAFSNNRVTCESKNDCGKRKSLQ